MQPKILEKTPRKTHVEPNLHDYERQRADFSWTEARRELDGLPHGRGLNIAHEAVDRHVAHGRGDRLAIRWLGKHGAMQDVTYRDLARRSNRFANALRSLGVGPGDGVFLLLGRIPELYVAAFGALKNRSVVCPLFSAFGPDPIRQRLVLGNARVLVTTDASYRKKVAELRRDVPSLEHVIVVGEEQPEETLSWRELLAQQATSHVIEPTSEEDAAFVHFTSGTTGTPKGALHVHQAVLMHHLTGKWALDLHPDDVFWCTADPGWVTGTSYGIVAPLTAGASMIVDEAEIDVERWYRILDEQQVTVWYTAPTAIRMLMRAGTELPWHYDLSHLRFAASVGEPLNPEAVIWGDEVLGVPFHDNWWQTETGGIMISNYASVPIRPGSMGLALPGVVAAVVERRGNHVEVVATPGEQGELALRTGWPSMFRGYVNAPERYAKCFASGWYLTGDLAKRDRDGYFWFVGRADDVIKSSGHLIGPFEVESVLLEHRAVAEAAVIGVPDSIAGERVKAFIALKPGYNESETLRVDVLAHSRRRLGSSVAPREIAFASDLPKTRSGKIMRRLLRARELGLPEGDTSTLEGGAP